MSSRRTRSSTDMPRSSQRTDDQGCFVRHLTRRQLTRRRPPGYCWVSSWRQVAKRRRRTRSVGGPGSDPPTPGATRGAAECPPEPGEGRLVQERVKVGRFGGLDQDRAVEVDDAAGAAEVM